LVYIPRFLSSHPLFFDALAFTSLLLSLFGQKTVLFIYPLVKCLYWPPHRLVDIFFVVIFFDTTPPSPDVRCSFCPRISALGSAILLISVLFFVLLCTLNLPFLELSKTGLIRVLSPLLPSAFGGNTSFSSEAPGVFLMKMAHLLNTISTTDPRVYIPPLGRTFLTPPCVLLQCTLNPHFFWKPPSGRSSP